MRLLLDTHIALWALTDDSRLAADARSAIVAADTVAVSVVTLWEIAIKHSLGRGDIPIDSAEADRFFTDAGFEVLALRAAHVHGVAALPALHSDPFDRLLIAQARSAQLLLVSADSRLVAYGDGVMPA